MDLAVGIGDFLSSTHGEQFCHKSCQMLELRYGEHWMRLFSSSFLVYADPKGAP